MIPSPAESRQAAATQWRTRATTQLPIIPLYAVDPSVAGCRPDGPDTENSCRIGSDGQRSRIPHILRFFFQVNFLTRVNAFLNHAPRRRWQNFDSQSSK